MAMELNKHSSPEIQGSNGIKMYKQLISCYSYIHTHSYRAMYITNHYLSDKTINLHEIFLKSKTIDGI